jgi:hypothetical protein
MGSLHRLRRIRLWLLPVHTEWKARARANTNENQEEFSNTHLESQYNCLES